MARKTKEDADITRQAILDAAEVVFMESGITNATMSEIADQAQISRGAIYGHYKNKMEVAMRMCDRGFLEMKTWQMPDSGVVSEVLRSASMTYLQRTLLKGHLDTVLEILYLKCEQSKDNEPLLRRRRFFEKRIMHAIKQMVKDGVSRAELSMQLDIQLASEFLYTVLDGVYGGLIWGKEDHDIDWIKIEALLKTGISTLMYSPNLLRD